MDISKVAVIGSGTMGNGIAHSFAQHGFDVVLVDISTTQLEKALETISQNLERLITKEIIKRALKEETLHRIRTSTVLSEAVKDVDLVVEAATEDLQLKCKIFKEIDTHAPQGCILATNTSSISITKIASVTKRPEAVIGMHFMNPVPVMKLVEVINGYATSATVTQQIVEVAKELRKTPCVVNDYPGFVANRILIPMINEAIYTLYEGVATVSAIDDVMKLGMAHPMGPLQLADLIGLDVCLSILNVLHDGFGHPKYAPCPLLVNMVHAGKLGVKTGEGFYIHTPGKKDLIVSKRFA